MEPYLGQIQLFGFSHPPLGWAACNGQIMSIAQYTALFSLLGTYYGGDGVTTFGLPDLRGRVAIGQGQGPGLQPYTIGEKSGSEFVTLLSTQMPMHNHQLMVSNATGTTDMATGNYLANGAVTIARGNTVPANLYATGQNAQLNPNAVSIQGGNQPHENRAPFLTLNYCIAVVGIYPSRN